MARRFSNACFKLPRNADRGSPLAVVGGNGVAIVVAQINATNNRKVFILMPAKTVKKHQNRQNGENKVRKFNQIFTYSFLSFILLVG